MNFVFKRKQIPRRGETRTITKFLLFLKFISDKYNIEVRWLERASIYQKYFLGWYDVEFTDKPVKINITYEDICSAYSNKCCPIKLVLSRLINSKYNIEIIRNIKNQLILILSTLNYTYDNKGFNTKLPSSVNKFLIRFDDNKSVKPISFTIKLPKEVLK